MTGYKDFQSGAVLSEGDLDNFLMQGVLVFTDAGTRDTALGSPPSVSTALFHGRVVYLTASNALQIYNATLAGGANYVNVATETYVNNAIATIRDPLIRLHMDAGLSMM